MSFGVSIGDAFAVGNFAWKVYRACKSAPGEFSELSRNVASLHTAIQEVSDEVQNADSILNRSSHQTAELKKIMINCHAVLTDLEQLLAKHGSLGNPDANGKRKAWDRLKFGTKDLNSIRENLVFNTSTISVFLQTLGTGSLGRIETRLDELIREVRQGKRESTTIMIFGEQNDPQDVCWTGLQNAVQEEGITRSEIDAHQNGIRAYLQEQVEKFDLPTRGRTMHGPDTEGISQSGPKIKGLDDVTVHQGASPTSKRRKSDDLILQGPILPPLESSSARHPGFPPEGTLTDHHRRSRSQFEEDISVLKQLEATYDALRSTASNIPRQKDKYFHSDDDCRISTKEALETSKESPYMGRRISDGVFQPQWPQMSSSLRDLSPHGIERTFPGTLEETSTDVSEYDDQGRLRKRTITRRSSNASSLHSPGSMTPPFFPASRQSPISSPYTSIWESQSTHGSTNVDTTNLKHLDNDSARACARQIGEVDTSMHASFADKLRARLDAVLASNRIHERNFDILTDENSRLKSNIEQLKSTDVKRKKAIDELIEQKMGQVTVALYAEDRSEKLSRAKKHYKEERNFFRDAAIKLGWKSVVSRLADPPSP